MYQQVRQHCPSCQGKGKSIKDKDKCKECKGNKVKIVTNELEISIERGTPQGA